MTMLHAVARKGRYHIERTPNWNGINWHAIDSHATKPISRRLGNFKGPFDAWKHIQGLANG